MIAILVDLCNDVAVIIMIVKTQNASNNPKEMLQEKTQNSL